MDAEPMLARFNVSSLRRSRPEPVSPLRMIFMPGPWLLERYYGGSWTAGMVFMTKSAISFAPNKLSATLKSQPDRWTIPFRDIAGVSEKKGMVASVIDIHHPGGAQRVMCARGDRLAERIEEARAAVSSADGDGSEA